VSDVRPGLNPQRLIGLIKAAIKRCELDLRGTVVLTEAASGAYVVTPVLAAMAGAEQVLSVTRPTRHGTTSEVRRQTEELAVLAGVRDCIQIVTENSRAIVSQADIVTNSGHVRPIDAEMVSWMKPTAVIPLMYEAWELRPEDVDLVACRERGIAVAGTNERHPAVDVFSFLGVMAVKLLLDAAVAVYLSRVLLLCDNQFGGFIERGLIGAGARVDVSQALSEAPGGRAYDAILVALQPRPEPVLSAEDAATIAKNWSGTVIAQFWGDIDRPALLATGLSVWPAEPPMSGHMGILPSVVGPEPIVRLQAGGLKVGELMASMRRRPASEGTTEAAERAAAASGFGQVLL
jgi:hypothetical protein